MKSMTSIQGPVGVNGLLGDVKLNFESSRQLRRIWELPSNLKCPLVGTCLNDREILKILRKARYKTMKHASSFMLHSCIMEKLQEENRISVAADHYLRRKYRKSLFEFVDLDESAFMEVWKERLKTGPFDDLFYVSSVRRDLSQESSTAIYGEVHMLGHASVREAGRNQAELVRMRERNDALQQKLKERKDRYRYVKKELSAVRAELDGAYRRIAQLSEENALAKRDVAPIRIDHEKREWRDRISELEVENRRAIKENRQLEREKRKLQIELFELRSTNQTLAEEVKTLVGQFAALSSCPDRECTGECRHQSMCARRVLIVGGITRIKHLYRDLVESGGGELDYHDGYLRAGKQAIDAKVRRADLVICPVSCNSHGACEQVKRLCKKYDKPVKMLPTSSLSAVSSVLYSQN